MKNRKFPVKLFWVTLLSGCLLFFLVILSRDKLWKKDYHQCMVQLADQISNFRTKYSRLPDQQEFLGLQLESRYLHLEDFEYEYIMILEDSPSDTVVTYTPLPDLWILTPDHLVLHLNGNVAWYSPEELLQAVIKRNQHYNRQILAPERTSP
jgi:hypothetical protein